MGMVKMVREKKGEEEGEQGRKNVYPDGRGRCERVMDRSMDLPQGGYRINGWNTNEIGIRIDWNGAQNRNIFGRKSGG